MAAAKREPKRHSLCRSSSEANCTSCTWTQNERPKLHAGTVPILGRFYKPSGLFERERQQALIHVLSPSLSSSGCRLCAVSGNPFEAGFALAAARALPAASRIALTVGVFGSRGRIGTTPCPIRRVAEIGGNVGHVLRGEGNRKGVIGAA